MSGSETGVMSSREVAYSLGMQQKSSVASQPVMHNMRLAYSGDGTAVYKPINASSPTYHQPPATSGGGAAMAEGSAGGSPVVTQGSEPLKRKRGRPRKYGPDGSMPMPVGLIQQAPPSSVGVTQSNSGGAFPSPSPPPPPPPLPSPTSTKKARGRPLGSGKKHQLEALGTFFYLSLSLSPDECTTVCGS